MHILDPEIPEGVDPSFLAALPEHIRQEVISEQLRLQRIRRRAQEQAQQNASASEAGGEGNSTMEVNPEFLAALPPAIQEEVRHTGCFLQVILNCTCSSRIHNIDSPDHFQGTLKHSDICR